MDFRICINSKLSSMDKKGFTLMELVIAILIFSIGIMGTVKMQSMAVKGNAYSMQFTEATTVTQNTIERLMGLPQSSTSLGGTAPLTATFTVSAPDVTSGQTVFSPSWAVNQVGTTGVRQVDLQVTWNEQALTHNISISFIKGP